MLKINHLRKSIGNLKLADNISLQIDQGERHAIIGPNGAGKTSLFNLITGNMPSDSGSIIYNTKDITRMASHRRVGLGIARSFQRNNLFMGYSVRNNLRFADIASKGLGYCFWKSGYKESDARVESISERLHLEEYMEFPVSELSYGTLRQLEIGLALLCEPKLLLLDEPTAGMSPQETKQMLLLIDSLPDDLSILLIEHDMDIVFGHAHRITVMASGGILMSGTADEVRSSDVVRESYLGGDYVEG